MLNLRGLYEGEEVFEVVYKSVVKFVSLKMVDLSCKEFVIGGLTFLILVRRVPYVKQAERREIANILRGKVDEYELEREH